MTLNIILSLVITYYSNGKHKYVRQTSTNTNTHIEAGAIMRPPYDPYPLSTKKPHMA
jgi:hypothetical protein